MGLVFICWGRLSGHGELGVLVLARRRKQTPFGKEFCGKGRFITITYCQAQSAFLFGLKFQAVYIFNAVKRLEVFPRHFRTFTNFTHFHCDDRNYGLVFWGWSEREWSGKDQALEVSGGVGISVG